MDAPTDPASVRRRTGRGRPRLARVVCGIDGSAASLIAAHEVARLIPPGGRLALVAALDPADLIVGTRGRHVQNVALSVARRARRGLLLAHQAAPPSAHVERRIVSGSAEVALLTEARRIRARLVAVGAPAQGRIAGAILGGTVTGLLHHAPCSVLVARTPPSPASPPRVVAGVDGSRQSLDALALAAHLSALLGAELEVVVGTGGKRIDPDAVREVCGCPVSLDRRRPAQALIDAGATARLVVVGNRGLHGLRRLGSVSERVAHEAPCSVLVVRTGGEAAPAGEPAAGTVG